MAEDRRHTRLLPDPVPEPPGGEARAGGGDSEAREGPTGAGGARGEFPLKVILSLEIKRSYIVF